MTAGIPCRARSSLSCARNSASDCSACGSPQKTLMSAVISTCCGTERSPCYRRKPSNTLFERYAAPVRDAKQPTSAPASFRTPFAGHLPGYRQRARPRHRQGRQGVQHRNRSAVGMGTRQAKGTGADTGHLVFVNARLRPGQMEVRVTEPAPVDCRGTDRCYRGTFVTDK